MTVRWFLVMLIVAFGVLALLTTPLDSDAVPIFVLVVVVTVALVGLVLTVGRSRER